MHKTKHELYSLYITKIKGMKHKTCKETKHLTIDKWVTINAYTSKIILKTLFSVQPCSLHRRLKERHSHMSLQDIGEKELGVVPYHLKGKPKDNSRSERISRLWNLSSCCRVLRNQIISCYLESLRSRLHLLRQPDRSHLAGASSGC